MTAIYISRRKHDFARLSVQFLGWVYSLILGSLHTSKNCSTCLDSHWFDPDACMQCLVWENIHHPKGTGVCSSLVPWINMKVSPNNHELSKMRVVRSEGTLCNVQSHQFIFFGRSFWLLLITSPAKRGTNWPTQKRKADSLPIAPKFDCSGSIPLNWQRLSGMSPVSTSQKTKKARCCTSYANHFLMSKLDTSSPVKMSGIYPMTEIDVKDCTYIFQVFVLSTNQPQLNLWTGSWPLYTLVSFS